MDTTTEISSELLKLLYIFSFSLGLWTCLSTLINKQCPSEAKWVLLLFISILLLIPLNGYLALVADEPPLILNSLASTLTWCYGPLMFALVNNIIQKKQALAKIFPHFIPFLLVASLHFLRLEWLTFKAYQFSLLLQTAIYLCASFFILYRYRKRIAILGKEFKNSTYYWMLYLIAGLLVIVLYDIGLIFLLQQGNSINFYFVAMTICAFSVYISTISIFLLFQPNIFAQETNHDDTPDQQKDNTTNEKLRNVELTPCAATELGQNLKNLIEKHKPHLESDISLAKLASLLGVSTHQLSELLNIHLETNFYDFLNSLRYKEAIRLMNEQPDRHSVTDIAYLSGFNNRNSFYRVFKQNSGLTPGEYRKKNSTCTKIDSPKSEGGRV